MLKEARVIFGYDVPKIFLFSGYVDLKRKLRLKIDFAILNTYLDKIFVYTFIEKNLLLHVTKITIVIFFGGSQNNKQINFAFLIGIVFQKKGNKML